MNVKEINSQLQIVALITQKFPTKDGYYMPTGYTLKHPDLGYLSFGNDYPYIPVGGRKALKEILKTGGMVNFDNVKWLQEIK